jgi:hypothetical protein
VDVRRVSLKVEGIAEHWDRYRHPGELSFFEEGGVTLTLIGIFSHAVGLASWIQVAADRVGAGMENRSAL